MSSTGFFGAAFAPLAAAGRGLPPGGVRPVS
jgi:hypothetical protein